MQIIISPARKMRVDTDSLPYRTLPQFIDQAAVILDYLKARSPAELHELWQCSERLVMANYHRIHRVDLHHNLTPALLAFVGLQYQAMGADVFSDAEWEYVHRHLRILSGFYGILRPGDGIVPYRLGMNEPAQVAGTANLYHYWGDRLAQTLFAEDNLVLNLASKEYAQAIIPYLTPTQQFVTCIFGELHNGKVKQKATRAKQARGNMVAYLAAHNIDDLAGVKRFNINYHYDSKRSTPQQLVFLANENNH